MRAVKIFWYARTEQTHSHCDGFHPDCRIALFSRVRYKLPLFGCSPVAQSNLAQSSDPHAHCHAKKDQSEQSATSNKIRFRSSEPERHKQSQIPECEIHAFATVLSPRVKGASSTSLQLLHLDVARLADCSFWSLSDKPSLIKITTPFRPPPTLAKLSALRI